MKNAKQARKIHVCETLIRPISQQMENRLDLELSPTDLDIYRGHILIKDYLSSKFEAVGAKRF